MMNPSGTYPADTTHPLSLRWIDLDRAGPTARFEAGVSEDERARADRFVQAIHRHRHLVAHTWLREVLGELAGTPPLSLTFDVGPFGKPSLAGGPAFNLSHSDHLAVVATAASGEIGVDVELLRPMADARLLASHHFTPAEQAELAAQPSDAGGTLAFLLGWTRKEACMKAAGCGLQVEPVAIETGLSPDARTVRFDVPQGRVAVEVRSLVDGDRAVVSWAWLTRP